MNIRFDKSEIFGTVTAVPSKSYLHRALICAALSSGKSVIQPFYVCDDVMATVDCLREMGAHITIHGTSAEVRGMDITKRNKPIVLNCRESGSTFRFLLPLSLILFGDVTLKCQGSLGQRKHNIYFDLFQSIGSVCVDKTVDGYHLKGKLSEQVITVDGSFGSQYVSGLLLCLPFMNKGSTIRIVNRLVSKPYVDITLAVMKEFGVSVNNGNYSDFTLERKASYISTDYSVEGDYSNASFFEAFNYCSGNVSVLELVNDSLQGDSIQFQLFESLKSGFCEIDVSDCPDLSPILMTVASLNHGCRLVGTKRLNNKESDRGNTMKTELEKFGVSVQIKDNEIVVFGDAVSPVGEVFCHNDHRIAMALSVLLSLKGGILIGAECVNKSMPSFFEELKKINAHFEIEENPCKI